MTGCCVIKWIIVLVVANKKMLPTDVGGFASIGNGAKWAALVLE